MTVEDPDVQPTPDPEPAEEPAEEPSHGEMPVDPDEDDEPAVS